VGHARDCRKRARPAVGADHADGATAPRPHQVEAAIAALHDDAASAQETAWPQILAWYDDLVALTDDRNLLDSATLLRLGYNGSDGFPRVIPIGFDWNGSQIVVCTAVTAPKLKALSSRPNVAMMIDLGDTPTEAKALLVRGLASVDIVDGVPDEYVAASTKALGADQVTEFDRQVRSMYDQVARFSIEPVWARFFDFGPGRMPSFLTKLAGHA
jgi:hypothetical protein